MSSYKNESMLLLEEKLLTQGDASVLSFVNFIVYPSKSNCFISCAKELLILQELCICFIFY